MTTRIVKNYKFSGAAGHRRQVKFTANDGEVALATASTDLVIGVVDFPGGVADGGRGDVVLFGPAEVECAGTIAPGGYFTADATGKAVSAAPGAGTNSNTGGRLLVGAVSGDIAKVLVNPTRIQG